MTSMTKPRKQAPTLKEGLSPIADAGRSPPRAKPFFRICHSEVLRERTLSLLNTIEQADDPTEHRKALSDLVGELTNSGLDYCFMRPLKLAKPGFVVEQTAKLGLAGVQQVMGSVVRQILGRMDGKQLVSVSGSIRQLML